MNLRISLVCPEYFGYGTSYLKALESLGHQVSAHFYGGYDADRGLLRRTRDLAIHEVLPRAGLGNLATPLERAFNRSVARSVRRERPDVVLVVNGGVLEPSLVRELSSLSTLLFWAFDSLHYFPNLVRTFGAYAVIACFSRVDADRVRNEGYNSMYLPIGYDPLVFGPQANSKLRTKVGDVTFVGARYPSREVLFNEIAEGADLQIWGGGWRPKPWRPRYYRRRTTLERLSMGNADRRTANVIYQSSKICLNAHGPWDGLNPRVFEIPGAGGFQLCDDQPDLAEMFEPGREVETFGSPSEALEKIRFYLAHDDARRRIAAAGQKRARREHTLASRLSRLLAEL